MKYGVWFSWRSLVPRLGMEVRDIPSYSEALRDNKPKNGDGEFKNGTSC